MCAFETLAVYTFTSRVWGCLPLTNTLSPQHTLRNTRVSPPTWAGRCGATEPTPPTSRRSQPWSRRAKRRWCRATGKCCMYVLRPPTHTTSPPTHHPSPIQITNPPPTPSNTHAYLLSPLPQSNAPPLTITYTGGSSTSTSPPAPRPGSCRSTPPSPLPCRPMGRWSMCCRGRTGPSDPCGRTTGRLEYECDGRV